MPCHYPKYSLQLLKMPPLSNKSTTQSAQLGGTAAIQVLVPLKHSSHLKNEKGNEKNEPKKLLMGNFVGPKGKLNKRKD